MASRDQRNTPYKVLITAFVCVSELRYSTDLCNLNQTMIWLLLPWKVRNKLFVTEHLDSSGILTTFPFSILLLGNGLGSTNPWLINIAKEPLPSQRQGFLPCLALTSTGILIPARSSLPYGKNSAQARRQSTMFFWNICSIGNQLSPVHLRGISPWRVSCYALFKG